MGGGRRGGRGAWLGRGGGEGRCVGGRGGGSGWRERVSGCWWVGRWSEAIVGEVGKGYEHRCRVANATGR